MALAGLELATKTRLVSNLQLSSWVSSLTLILMILNKVIGKVQH